MTMTMDDYERAVAPIRDHEMPVVAVHPSGEAQEEVASDFGTAFLLLVREALDSDTGDRAWRR